MQINEIFIRTNINSLHPIETTKVMELDKL